MKKVKLFISLVLLSFFICSLEVYSQGVPDRYIVVFHDWVNHADLNAARLANQHGLSLGHVYQHALKGFVATVPANRLDLIKNDLDVQYVSQDQIVSLVGNDRVSGPGKPSGGKGGATQPAQVLPAGVNRVNADLSSLAVIDGQDQRVDVDVAVIDTGIDKSHADLNVVGGVNFSTGRSTNFNDGNGHGTHVSGTIGALDNAIGVVGVAPGARLWAVRVLDNNGSGFLSDVIAGIDWVTQRADLIDVANMSLGWTEDPSSPSPARDALRNSVARGVVYAVAAGNNSNDAQNFAPASYSEVMTVSAIVDTDGLSGGWGPQTSYGADDTFATFSNFGSVVDLAAPGVDVLSTLPGGLYGKKSGTSMASPHVAGALALYVVRYGKPFDSLGVEAVRQGLIQFGVPQNSQDGFTGDSDGFAEPLVNAQF